MWSIKYKECIKCGTRERKHLGRGLCKSCYQIDIENRSKQNRKPKKERKEAEIPHKILTREYLFREYCENNKSLGDIAKESNCSRQYVYKVISLCGFDLRDKRSARTLALDKGKIAVMRHDDIGNTTKQTFQRTRYKEDFFSSWSPEMAYVLGVIYTDGHLDAGKLRNPSSRTTSLAPRVAISQKDPEFLKLILSLMECDAKLLFQKRTVRKLKRENREIVQGELYRFELYGDKIYDQLLSLGLFPHKSLTIEFPKIPSEYLRHFIRGCWDGDGSIYVEKRSGRKNASYISGSKKFIEGMLAELEKAGLPRRTIHEINRKNISYYFRFTGEQVHKLYHFLYDDVPSTQYLERKYNLFKTS